MEGTLKAIAEPHRRQILTMLRDGELSAGAIARRFKVTPSAVSQHLTVLKDEGLLAERRDGTKRFYRARPQGMAALKVFLEAFWDERLLSLKEEARRGGPQLRSGLLEVERHVVVDAPPPDVWPYLVEPDLVTSWMGVRGTYDVRPGGSYRLEVVPSAHAEGTFSVVEPPSRLVFTWGWAAGAGSVRPGSTTVNVSLQQKSGRKTELRLTHGDLPSLDAATTHANGWGHYLPRLSLAAAGRDPGLDPWRTAPDLFLEELFDGTIRSWRKE
ncbi:MAG TPA: metalloregulator ArsR/SmtB family transcription factor [Acidimicrobiia bacterium]